MFRGVAQLGRALPWGGRGRGFESRRSDHFRNLSLYGNPVKAFLFDLLPEVDIAMIRTVKLVCSLCEKTFMPKDGVLYYKDNFMNRTVKDARFICPACIKKWHEKWHIKSAEFFEKDEVLTVDIELEDGTVFKKLDCTVLQETVVASEDIPEEAQKVLFEIYTQWDNERKVNVLKYCTFNEEFMRTTFSCATYGGESYEHIAFRFTSRGEFQTEKPVPDYIAEQVVNAYTLYESSNR